MQPLPHPIKGSAYETAASEVFVDGGWESGPNLPKNFKGGCVQPLEDDWSRSLLVSGHSGTINLNRAWVYDLAANSWTETSAYGTARRQGQTSGCD